MPKTTIQYTTILAKQFIFEKLEKYTELAAALRRYLPTTVCSAPAARLRRNSSICHSNGINIERAAKEKSALQIVDSKNRKKKKHNQIQIIYFMNREIFVGWQRCSKCEQHRFSGFGEIIFRTHGQTE